MKKILISLAVALFDVGAYAVTEGSLGTNPDMPDAPTWTGSTVGHNVVIKNGIVGAIAIGDGSTATVTRVKANYAIQIGAGSNLTASTFQVFSREMLDANGNIPIAAMTNALVSSGFTNATYPSITLGAISNALLTGTSPIAATTLASSAGVTVGTTLGVSGTSSLTNTTVNGTLTLGGAAVIAGTPTISGAPTITGVASFTAAPRFNAAIGTPGAVTCLLTNGPTSTTVQPKWVSVSVNGTNCWMAAWPQ